MENKYYEQFVGQTFSHLTILSFEPRRKGIPYCKCRCKCGKEKVIRFVSVSQRVTHSCGCIRNTDLHGKKFGMLTVLSLASNTDKICHDRYWLCKCDCDSEPKKIRQSHLLKGKIQSCGCQQFQLRGNHPCWKGVGEMSGAFLNIIKRGAKERKLEFSITPEYIWDLFLKQNRKCNLTGLDLKFASKWTVSDGTASLDRIDSSKGYVEGNVQWVHKDVNKMKMEFPLNKFIEYCKLIYLKNSLTSQRQA